MDFTEYISDLSRALETLANSQDFEINYEIGSPQPESDIVELEEYVADFLQDNNFRIWRVFTDFYKKSRKITFGWQYLGHSDQARITCGSSRIQSIISLYDPENEIGESFKLYDRCRVLDHIGTENHVSVKFSKEQAEPELYYYVSRDNSFHLMSIGFLDYLRLTLQTRGMYPWHEFFLKDGFVTINRSRAIQFLEDMERLFPEIDRSQFQMEGKWALHNRAIDGGD
ncbi:hypothetical protein LQF76_09100 [Gloeomargaritales cyanobacterium VI4D9]|nr:hypothetical protein LQF76_09100 [Gloeomargaritales cyanobacterium VI4D9]